jgi:PKD repeat protein
MGDGTFDSTAFANHTYPAGVYTVCLTISDNAGICSASICDTITVTVTPPPCTTTFTYTDNGSGNMNFQVDPFVFGMTYTWDFGDSTSGSGFFTNHTFPMYGTYVVCLTAVDSSTLCTSTFCDTITLAQDTTNCDVSFTNFNNNGQVFFAANSGSFNNSYTWDFGDGNASTGAGTSNTYMASGTYYVCLTTSNAFDACTATYCDSVVVVIAGILEQEQNNFNLSSYPNPANEQATVSYYLNTDADVQLLISDITGRKIQLIEEGKRNRGKHSVTLNAENIESGIYLLQIQVNQKIQTRKIVVTK